MPASLVIPKFRAGKLHSGSKQGPLVRSRKQATAIVLSEARKEGYKIPKPPKKARSLRSMLTSN